MVIAAPMACSPLTCWSTGRCPIAQPPGSDTLARPQRASSGPSTSTEARMVLTSSYGAVGSLIERACRRMPPSAAGCTSTPIWASSLAMVATSISRGTPASCSGLALSNAAHMIGRAAFLAPDTRASPRSSRPPVILSLSTGAPLLRRDGTHGKRVDLLAHALAERRVHHLVALHAAAPGEAGADHQRLEVLAVADHLDMLAGQACLDAGFYAVWRHHRNWYPDRRRKRQRNDTTKRLARTTARRRPGEKSATPKRP